MSRAFDALVQALVARQAGVAADEGRRGRRPGFLSRRGSFLRRGRRFLLSDWRRLHGGGHERQRDERWCRSGTQDQTDAAEAVYSGRV
jgi:hypothetical protein